MPSLCSVKRLRLGKPAMLLLALLTLPRPCLSQNRDLPPARDSDLPNFDIEGVYPIVDLAEKPLSVEVLQFASLHFRDEYIGQKIRASIDALQPVMTDSIKNTKAGYLVRTNLYLDEFGTPFVPGAQLMTPIGVGLEPVDALADFDSHPQIRADIPPGLRNQSFFLWFAPKDGKLTATIIPQEFRAATERAAQDEADRRRDLGIWNDAKLSFVGDPIRRADFWVDVYESRKASLADSALLRDIQRLNRQAIVLQARLNKLNNEYRQTLTNLVSAQADVQALNSLSTVVSLVSDGIKVGDIIYGVDGHESPISPQSTQMNVSSPIDDLLKFRRRSVETMSNLQTIQDLQIRGNTEAFKKLDDELRSKWGESGLSIPKPAPIPVR